VYKSSLDPIMPGFRRIKPRQGSYDMNAERWAVVKADIKVLGDGRYSARMLAFGGPDH
jgi:hypothetical protein